MNEWAQPQALLNMDSEEEKAQKVLNEDSDHYTDTFQSEDDLVEKLNDELEEEEKKEQPISVHFQKRFPECRNERRNGTPTFGSHNYGNKRRAGFQVISAFSKPAQPSQPQGKPQ